MVRLSRRSRNSQQRRRQSQRRGGRPPKAEEEPLTLITGRDGSFCAEKPENDCKKIKACDWMPPNARQKQGYCRSRQDRGTGESSQQFKEIEAANEQRRAASLREVYESPHEESQSEQIALVPSSLVVYRPKKSPKKPRSPSPAQLRRAAAKASGVEYVPVKGANVPLGCVQKEYDLTSAKGKSFKTTRCVDSKDPNQNDAANCMVNPQTNKCKTRGRD